MLHLSDKCIEERVVYFFDKEEEDMASFKESYHGCEIEIENDTELTINGKQIDYQHNRIVNSWSSKYLPYTDYDTLLDLARAIARDTVEFSPNQ